MAIPIAEDQIIRNVEKLSEAVVSIDSTVFVRSFRLGVVPMKGSGITLDKTANTYKQSCNGWGRQSVCESYCDGRINQSRK